MNAIAAPKSSAQNRLEGFALTVLLQGFPSFAGAALLLKLAHHEIAAGVVLFVAMASIFHGLLTPWLAPRFPRNLQTQLRAAVLRCRPVVYREDREVARPTHDIAAAGDERAVAVAAGGGRDEYALGSATRHSRASANYDVQSHVREIRDAILVTDCGTTQETFRSGEALPASSKPASWTRDAFGSGSRFPGQNKSTALPDLSRIVTQVAAKGRARRGRNTGVSHVRSFAILLRRFCSSRRSGHVACVFEYFYRLVQYHSPASHAARCRGSGRGVLVAARQVDGGRPTLGLSIGRPPQMLVPGRRGDRGEEAGSSSRREVSRRRFRGERGRAAQAEGGRGCACGAVALRTGGNVSADATCARGQDG